MAKKSMKKTEMPAKAAKKEEMPADKAGLTAAQKKLPPALQTAMLKKMKKK